MKKLLLIFLLCIFIEKTFAQKETFDLFTYVEPKGWTKTVEENFVSYIKTDERNNWCRINITKSTISKGTIEDDFESEWQGLIVNNYHPTESRKENEVQEADGWKIKAGTSKFTFENKEATAMLTTISGYERCLSIVAVANNREYVADIQALIESIDLIKPEAPAAETNTIENSSEGETTTSVPTSEAAATGNAENSIIGTWVMSSSNQSNYAIGNGINGYIKRQYSFNTDGTYTFFTKNFEYYLNKLLLTRESGTFQIDGNNITIAPNKSLIEAWSKKDGSDKWGKLLSTQKRPLEKVTYTLTKHYFSGIQEWNLVLQADRTTERDGPYSSNTTFNNAWYYAVGKYPIELP